MDPSGPSRVGFPMAPGQEPYKPVNQFNQFQPPTMSDAKGYPTGAGNITASSGATSPQYIAQSASGQSHPFPQGPALSNGSAFRPFEPTTQNRPPLLNGYNSPALHMNPTPTNCGLLPPGPGTPFNAPVPAHTPTTTALPPGPVNAPRPNVAYPFPTPQQPSFQPACTQPPTSVHPPFPMSAVPGVPGSANSPYGSPGYGQYPTAVNQVTQNVGQMNMGGPAQGGQWPQTAQPQQQAPAQMPWGQQSMQPQAQPMSGHAVEVMDLMSERNVTGSDFAEPADFTLPHSIANSEARVDPSVMRCTLNAVPQTEELLTKSRLPFGLTLHPFRDMKNLNVVQTSSIVRCRFCRTYINPFVQLPNNRQWRCNLCGRSNDLPDDFCWDPATKSFGEPSSRPEIRFATVEFIAPSEYMLRPPQPAVYFFVLDVSTAAIESGYLNTFAELLMLNLNQLPGDSNTMMGFMCVDACVHFFQFIDPVRLPCQLVVDDFEDSFLPSYAGLMVPLKKYKEAIHSFLRTLPKTFERSSSSTNCLGAALNMAHDIIGSTGGRISVFQVTMPTVGPGALQTREDPNQRAANDVQNLGPATDFYKRLALECTGHQVALDLFTFNSQYIDLASLSEMAKFSTGCVYHFPNYHNINDSVQTKRFEKIFTRYLTRKIGFEAVLRIRCSRGMGMSAFYGNFFVRSTDLLALANVNPDSAMAVQVNMEEKLGPTVAFQAALLYTSSKGDRRIRVHTMCLPTTSDMKKIFAGFDLKASVSLLAKLGVDRSMAGGALSDSREAMVNAVVDGIGAYQRTMGQGRNSILAPRTGHLRLFPLYALALLKHTAFCAGRSVRVDDRVAAMLMMRFCPLEQILSELVPQLYRINEITQMAEGEWPNALPASFEHIYRDGVYLLECGTCLYLYVPSSADPQLIADLFDCQYQQIDDYTFRERENETSRRVHEFIRYICALKFYLGPVQIIKEDSMLRESFLRRLVEDRSEATHSYVEFLQHIKREMAQ